MPTLKSTKNELIGFFVSLGILLFKTTMMFLVGVVVFPSLQSSTHLSGMRPRKWTMSSERYGEISLF